MLKKYFLLILLPSFLVLTASCGPADPGLGLGPPFDQLAGLVLIIFLFVAGYWAVKSFVASPAGRSLIKDAPAAREAVRERYPHGQAEQGRPPDAEEILRERYARGEIDRKQYLEMLDDIKRK